MSYLQPLNIANAPEDSKAILEAIEEKFGKVLNIFATAAYQPDVLGGLTQLNDGVRNDLPEKYRELAYYLSSQINHCDYCSHYHKQAAEKAGVSDRQLSNITSYQNSDAFSVEEKAVLSYAEQLTKNSQVESSVMEDLKGFLDEKQLVSLAATVALANFTNRFNHGLNIELP